MHLGSAEMFTPQRKQFPATDRKGKAVAFADEITTPSPPKGLRDSRFGAASGYAVDDWRALKDVGLLDEAYLERKDLDALIEKNLKLEKELFDYQHNMGLLLIEKKKWTSTNDELQQAFDEANEILKRERTSNLIALSQSEKREENLRKALISEKQFVAELEKDLKYLQQEHTEVKSTSEAKLAEANDLVIDTKKKALEVDRERAIAEEKLSVVNRKSSELERKLKEVETREKVLQRERLSLATEREAQEAVFYKQREDLQEWEKKLTVEEYRLSEAKRSINHKEKSLEEMQQKIDSAKSELKKREESIIIMLNEISTKEKDFKAMKTKVDNDMKEKELYGLQEKLIAREQMVIGKLFDDQKAILDSRMLDFELEKKKGEIEKLQVEISHKGDAALEKTKEKEKDLEARLKDVKEKEKALKAEEKKLHMEIERLLEDKESLRKLKDEIEEIGAETTKQESRIREEYESLRITKEERLEFLRLQSKLKEQTVRVKQEEKLLSKEREELKQDKGRFEKEWEALDEKKADIAREQKEVTEEIEKQRRNLDMELQRQEGEGEKDFNENINYKKKEMEELHYEKLSLKREREEISVKKKQLRKLHDELYKDVDDVDAVRISLKEQRDELCRSKERLLVFLKKVNLCNTCRISFREFVEDGDKLPEVSKSTSFVGILASAMVPESLQPDDSLDTVAGNDHEPSATVHSIAESKIQEAPEASLQPEIKSDKPRRVRGKASRNTDSKPSDVEIPRKRQREQASRNTESEHAAGDSDEGVDSITTGGHRKKRQTANPVSLAPAQSRYHLRRHRNVGTEEDKAQASTGAIEKQESVNGVVPSPKDNLNPPQGEKRENGKAEEIVKVESETEFKDKNTGKRPVEDPQLEAGGSCERKEHGEENDNRTSFSMIQEENEEEEETDHQGEASIGKKIWVFFTT